jgi:hypothetical protein
VKDLLAKPFVIRMLHRGDQALIVAPLRAPALGDVSATGSLALASSVTRAYVCWALRALCLKTAASVFVLAAIYDRAAILKVFRA